MEEVVQVILSRSLSSRTVGALVDYVDWVTLVVRVLRWDAKTRPTRHAFRLPEEVGLCRGRTVHTIEVVFDGRNIHAYPVEDR